MRISVMASTFASVALILTSAPVYAQDSAHGPMHASDLKWGPAPPVLPKGGQFVVLSGDPGKEGPFTIRLKAPAGYKVAAHNHPTAELVTVISGTFAVGMGDKLDEAKADKLKAGDFVALPANMNHFATFPEDTVVQISSKGPFKMTNLNPAAKPALTQ